MVCPTYDREELARMYRGEEEFLDESDWEPPMANLYLQFYCLRADRNFIFLRVLLESIDDYFFPGTHFYRRHTRLDRLSLHNRYWEMRLRVPIIPAPMSEIQDVFTAFRLAIYRREGVRVTYFFGVN